MPSGIEFLFGLITNWVSEYIKEAIFEEEGTEDELLTKQLFSAFREASEEFFKKYDASFGSPEGTFLAVRKNLDKFVRSMFYSKPNLTVNDLISKGPNGHETPQHALLDFLDMLDKASSKFPRLDEIKTNKKVNRLVEKVSVEVPQIAQNLDSVKQQMNNLQRGVDTINERLNTHPISNVSNSPLTTILVQEKAKHIKSVIDNGKLKSANEQLLSLMNTGGFVQLSPTDKIEYYYLKGLIQIRTNLLPHVQDTINRIEELDPYNPKSDILSATLSFETGDEQRLTTALQNLRSKETSQSEIDVIHAGFHTAQVNNPKVLELLTSEQGDIKEIHKNNARARIYLGVAYFNDRDFNNANKHLAVAYELNPLPYPKYLKLMSEVALTTSNRTLTDDLPPIERGTLEIALAELNLLEDYFADLDLVQQTGFWTHILTLLLYLDQPKAVMQAQLLPQNIQMQDNIQALLADAYYFTGDYASAEAIYNKLYDKLKSVDVLVKLLDTLFQQKKYPEVLNYYSVVLNLSEDQIGVLGIIILESCSKIKTFNEVIKVVNEFEPKYPKSAMFHHSVAVISYTHNELEYAKTYLQSSIDLLNSATAPLRSYVSETCRKIGLIDKAIEVIKPVSPYEESAKIDLIKLLIDSEDEANIEQAEELLNEAINQGTDNPFYYYTRGGIKQDCNDYAGALQDHEKVFELNPTKYSAYNVAVTKLRLNDTSDLEKYISYFDKSEEPRFIILLASINTALNREGSNYLAYKALHRLGNEFDEHIYIGYIHLNLPHNRQRENQTVEFNRVENNTVVVLQGDNAYRYICIDAEAGMIKQEGEISFNCDHYTPNHRIAIQLRALPINSNVKIEGQTFTVERIVNKFAFAFQHCLNTYTLHCPDSPYMTAIQVSTDDPITPMIPVLERLRKRGELFLEQYNDTIDGIGLPLSAFDIGSPERYVGTISKILNKPNQAFHAGRINFIDMNSKPVIVTLSSLVLLNLIGKLDILENLTNVCIPASLQDTVNQIFNKVTTEDVHSCGSMGMGDDGRPIYQEATEESKAYVTTFWRKILVELSRYHIESEIPSLGKEAVRQDIIGRFDLDAISLTNELDGILLSDDAFIRNLCDCHFSHMTNANIVSVINQFADKDTLFKLLHTLCRANYLFCIAPETLLRLVNILHESQLIIGEGTIFHEFKGIIHQLSQPSLIRTYLPHLRETIHHLASKTLIIPSTEHTIEIILTELRNSCLANRLLSSETLLKYILQPFNYDLRNKNYVRTLFNKIESFVVLPEET